MTKSMRKRKYLLVYTLVFAVFALSVFFLFLRKGKSMIWEQDGGPQYYPYLIYLGRWLRDAFSRAFHGDFTVRMYDFTIGLGNDVGSVARTHPLEMLSALVPAAYAETLYSVIILLRLYLAGLAFSYCASLYRPLSLSVITGSMIYVFSGFAVIFGVRHLIYGSAFIMLPLLIAGAEKIIRGGRGWLFSLAAFLGFICNYYFMYQATAACGVFILIRLIDRGLRRKDPARYETDENMIPAAGAGSTAKTAHTAGRRMRGRQDVKGASLPGAIVRLGAFYLLGLGMAMFAMLPVVASLGSSARIASQSVPENLLSYGGWRHYYRWFLNLIIPVRSQKGGTPLNYAVTAFPAIALLIGCSFRQHRVLKTSFLVGTVCIFSPLCAYVLSGFSVVSNRWIFCYSFVIGMAFVVFSEEMLAMRRGQRILIVVLALAYAELAVYDWTVSRSVYLIIAAAALVICIVALLRANRVVFMKKYGPAALLALTLLSCSVHSFLCYSGRFEDMLSEYLDRGQAMAEITDSEFVRLGTAAEEEGGAAFAERTFWRADSDVVNSDRENYSLLLGYAPTSVYNSVLSGPTTYFLMETGNSDLAAIHRIQGLDSRTVSEALANVKYYLTTADGGGHAPYGFALRQDMSDENNLVFENRYPLSFRYTCDRVIAEADLAELNALEKEQVMLDGVVLSDQDADEILQMGGENDQDAIKAIAAPAVKTEVRSLTLPETGENVKRTKNGYRVMQDGGKISFAFERIAGTEAYVRLSDFWTEKVSNFAGISTDTSRTAFSMRGPDTIYSLNRKEYYIRLGYDETDRMDTLTLELPEKGRYHLGGADILYVPMDSFEERIRQMNAQPLQDVTFSMNTVEGNVSAAGNCVMAFSIPYSAGWNVFVDGKKARAIEVNIGWLGTALTAGEHAIRLVYRTPGALPGRWISLAAWLIFALVCVFGRNRTGRKHTERTGNRERWKR